MKSCASSRRWRTSSGGSARWTTATTAASQRWRTARRTTAPLCRAKASAFRGIPSRGVSRSSRLERWVVWVLGDGSEDAWCFDVKLFV